MIHKLNEWNEYTYYYVIVHPISETELFRKIYNLNTASYSLSGVQVSLIGTRMFLADWS